MKNIFLIFISFLLFLSACKRTVKEGVVGPEIKSASADFKVLDTLKANYFDGYKVAKSDTVSFQFVEEIKIDTTIAGELVRGFVVAINYYNRKTCFKAKFNEEVSWNLTLTKLVNGQKDNSVKNVISGTSSYLDSTNTSWSGGANFTLFAEKDVVLAELGFVNGTSLVLTDTILILRGKLYNPTEASLVIDFETALNSNSAFPYQDNLDPTKSPILPRFDLDKNITPPQGSNSFILYGRDYNGDYFCGGINMQKVPFETMKNYSPRDIYLNMYIYGYPADNSLEISSKATKLNIGFSEKDNPLNTTAAFDPLTEDTFEKQISVDWVGWKLISVRYADLVPSASKTNGGSGNGRFEPGKAFSVNCNLISSPNGSTIGANIDYVIITYGQPFDANNL